MLNQLRKDMQKNSIFSAAISVQQCSCFTIRYITVIYQINCSSVSLARVVARPDSARSPPDIAVQVSPDVSSTSANKSGLLGEAFDAARERVAPGVGASSQSIEAARLKLADTILRLATSGALNAKELKDSALKRMFVDPLKL
jgi:hypothetical protein